jgi:hypothetical protein
LNFCSEVGAEEQQDLLLYLFELGERKKSRVITMGSFHLPSCGMQTMLMEGHKLLSGLEEAVLKNIEACIQLSKITSTSLGPNGMNKMVINHLDKLFVTNDAGTIVQELEVQQRQGKRRLVMEPTW